MTINPIIWSHNLAMCCLDVINIAPRCHNLLALGYEYVIHHLISLTISQGRSHHLVITFHCAHYFSTRWQHLTEMWDPTAKYTTTWWREERTSFLSMSSQERLWSTNLYFWMISERNLIFWYKLKTMVWSKKFGKQILRRRIKHLM